MYRPPSPWQQQRQNEGPSDGPIISENLWSGHLPPARAHVAVVLVHKKGNHEVLWPHNRHRHRSFHRPRTVYEVDLGLHHTTIETELPSKGDAFTFNAAITIQWRVIDPSAVTAHRVTDIKDIVSSHLLRQLRSIARKFDITESAEAEDEINEQTGSRAIVDAGHNHVGESLPDEEDNNYIGTEYGLWVRSIVQLTLDEPTIEHVAKIKKLSRALEEEKAEHELRMLREEHENRIRQDRMDIYRKIIAAGDFERFALQVANNPDDIGAIDAIIRDEQEVSRRDTIDFVARMVESGVVERWEVSDQAREALKWLKDSTSRVISERQHHREIEPSHRQRRKGRENADEGGASQPQSPSDTIEGQVTASTTESVHRDAPGPAE